jgi:hypothetical protein
MGGQTVRYSQESLLIHRVAPRVFDLSDDNISFPSSVQSTQNWANFETIFRIQFSVTNAFEQHPSGVWVIHFGASLWFIDTLCYQADIFMTF